MVESAIESVRFYNAFKLGFGSGTAAANVDLNVKVLAKDGHLTYATVVAGEGINKPIQLASGANAKIALERALHDAVSKLFADGAFVDS